MLQAPPSPEQSAKIQLIKGPNIALLPVLALFPNEFSLPILLKMGDNVSTDEILPAGAKVLPFRSSIPKISEFSFGIIDKTYPERAKQVRDAGGHAIIGGDNYGQGSSREHAALAPRFLGLQLAIAKNFARIHWQNLIHFGVLPLTFANPDDYDAIKQGDVIEMKGIRDALKNGSKLHATINSSAKEIALDHELSQRQLEVLLEGGLINWTKKP